MNEIYSGYEIELNKEENKAYKGKMLKIEGNSYQETRDRVDGTLVSDEFINITDAQDLQIRSFNIKGKGEQETREGYNKLNLEDYGTTSSTINSSTATEINVTAAIGVASESVLHFKNVLLETGKTYTIQRKITTTAGTKDYRAGRIEIYKGNGTTWLKSILSGDAEKSTFTVDENGTYSMRLYIAPASNTAEYSFTVSEFMVYEGTESKPYERYGKTPSMEFESPIKSVGDNIQLFDISTITANKFVYADSGEIGASTVSTTSDYIPVIANEIYTALLDYETLAQDGPRGIALYDNDKKYISGVTYTSSKKGFTYTPTQSGYLRFSYDNNCTVIKFSKGTSTGPYSPYGMGSVEIEHCNKNFLKVLNKTVTTQNGITITPNEDGTYTANGTSTGIVSYRITTEEGVNSFVQPLPAGKYIASCENTAYATHFLQFVMKDDVSGESWHNTSPTKEFETNGGTYQALIYIRSGVTLDNFVFKPMLRLASVEDGTYVEHQSQTKALYTQQPFRAIGDVEDTFAKKMGKWNEEHKIKRYIFTGNEDWTTETTADGFIRYKLSIPDIFNYTVEGRYTDKILCSHFKLGTINEWGVIFQYKKVLYLYANFATVDEWKAKLTELYNAGTPVYVDYVLETPEYIDCTEEQIKQLDYFYEEAKTYEGVNNVYSMDKVRPIITFRYNCLPALPSVEESSKVESVGDIINEFDKKNANILAAFPNGDTLIISKHAVAKILFISCEPNTVYTISKMPSTRFQLWDSVNLPAVGVKLNKALTLDYAFTGPSKTITTSPNAKYLIFYYYNTSTDKISEEEIIDSIKICKSTKETPYSPFGQGSIKIKHLNENFLEITSAKFTPTVEGWYDFNGISNMYNNTQYINSKTKIRLKAGKYYLSYGKTTNVNTVQIIKVDGTTYGKLIHARMGVFTLDEDSEIIVRLNVTTINIETSIEDVQISSGTEKKQFKPHQSEEFLLPMQEPFRKEGTYKDLFIKDNEKWYEHHNIFKWIFDGTENWYTVTNGKGVDCYVLALGSSQLARTLDIKSNMLKQTDDIWNIAERKDVVKISSGLNGINILMKGITTLEDFKGTLATLYEEGNPLYVEYVLKTPKLIPCTPQQSTILDQLENIQLYDGVNYIYTTDGIQPLLTLELYNMIEDYDLYVSNDGYFGIPGTDIKFLVNFYESNLPTMPEAVEASVRAAGRNGDYVLNTTYEPLPFEIVCFTEDNLTPTQKKEIESKVNRFLNSIKNRTKKIAFEKGEKFYNVKYNGLLTTTNYPAHLKFSIPLKSSESFGKDAYQKVLSGNSTEVSDTVEEVGALITINGPATLPIIALNDYSMEYSTSILEGARIEIDTAKSTATHINSDGVKTNVMRYYNHQFPKIQPGENTLKVLSGVDDENNVTVKWNDLKL